MRALATLAQVATLLNETSAIEPQLLSILQGLQSRRAWMMEELRPQTASEQMTAIQWSRAAPNGRSVLAGGFSDGSISVWAEPSDGARGVPHSDATGPLPDTEGHTSHITSLAWGVHPSDPQSLLLASAARDGKLLVWLWDATADTLLSPAVELRSGGQDVMSVDWYPSREAAGGVGGSEGVGGSASGSSQLTLLAAGSKNGNITIWSWLGWPDRAPAVLWTLSQSVDSTASLEGEPQVASPVAAVAFSPEGSVLAGGFEDGSVWAWRLADQHLALLTMHATADPLPEPQPRLVGNHAMRVTALAWHSSSQMLASAAASGFPFSPARADIRVWTAAGHSSEPELPVAVVETPFRREVTSLAWSPGLDARSIAVSSGSGDIFMYQLSENFGVVSQFALPAVGKVQRTPAHVSFSEKGLLATSHGAAGSDECRLGTARIWAVGDGLSSVQHHLTNNPLNAGAPAIESCCLCWDGEGRKLASAYRVTKADGSSVWRVTVWEVDKAGEVGVREAASWELPLHRVNSIAWHPLHSALAVGGNSTVLILDAATSAATDNTRLPLRSKRLEVGGGYVNALDWSASGVLAVASESGDLSIWNSARSALPAYTRKGSASADTKSRGWLAAVAWSPSASLVASGGQDGAVEVLDLATSETTVLFVDSARQSGSRSAYERSVPVESLSWSPEGHLLVGIANGLIGRWDPTSNSSELTLLHTKSSCLPLRKLDASSQSGRLLSGWGRRQRTADAHGREARGGGFVDPESRRRALRSRMSPCLLVATTCPSPLMTAQCRSSQLASEP